MRIGEAFATCNMIDEDTLSVKYKAGLSHFDDLSRLLLIAAQAAGDIRSLNGCHIRIRVEVIKE